MILKAGFSYKIGDYAKFFVRIIINKNKSPSEQD